MLDTKLCPLPAFVHVLPESAAAHCRLLPLQGPNQQLQRPPRKQQEQSQYVLTPRDAEAQREKMDKERRDEESKLFVAPSGVTVKRDW